MKKVLLFFVFVVVLFLITGILVVSSATSAKPGDILYGLDKSLEELQLNSTADPVVKAGLHLQFAYERIEELEAYLGGSQVFAVVSKVYAQDDSPDLSVIEQLLADFYANLEEAEVLINSLTDDNTAKQDLLDKIDEFIVTAQRIELKLKELAATDDRLLAGDLLESIADTIEISDGMLELLVTRLTDSDSDFKDLADRRVSDMISRAETDLARTRTKLDEALPSLTADEVIEAENYYNLAQDALTAANAAFDGGDLPMAYLQAKLSKSYSSIVRDILDATEDDEDTLKEEAAHKIEQAEEELTEAEKKLAESVNLPQEVLDEVNFLIITGRAELTAAETLFAEGNYLDAKVTAKSARQRGRDAQRLIERRSLVHDRDEDDLAEDIQELQNKLARYRNKLKNFLGDKDRVRALLNQAEVKLADALNLLETNPAAAENAKDEAKRLLSMADVLLDDDDDNESDDSTVDDSDDNKGKKDDSNDDQDNHRNDNNGSDSNGDDNEEDDNSGSNSGNGNSDDEEDEEEEEPEVEGATSTRGLLILL